MVRTDGPGANARRRIASRLGSKRTWWARTPEPYDDACELAIFVAVAMQTCDAVIAPTVDEKVKLAVGLLTKTELGVPSVVAMVIESSNESLFMQA